MCSLLFFQRRHPQEASVAGGRRRNGGARARPACSPLAVVASERTLGATAVVCQYAIAATPD